MDSKKNNQDNEHQSDQTFMKERLKWVEEAAKKLFTPGEVENDELDFND